MANLNDMMGDTTNKMNDMGSKFQNLTGEQKEKVNKFAQDNHLDPKNINQWPAEAKEKLKNMVFSK